ncbi:oncostatin-M-specific receptor subunit beta-like [Discoglossus pictus]
MGLFGLQNEITVLLLALNLIISHCQESTDQIAPLNLLIYNDSAQQRLFVQWNVSSQAYPSGSDIAFHIQVSRGKEINIVWNEIYRTKLSNLFEWSWESDLPLECASHHVRIRSSMDKNNATNNETKWSMWSPWKTVYGMDNSHRVRPIVFPNEKVVNEGSDVSVCCIPGRNQEVLQINYNNNEATSYVAPPTNNGTFIITIKNVSMTNVFGANIICTVTPRKIYGTVLLVSRPPDEPKNFNCETEDIKMLKCSWDPGELSNLSEDFATSYLLHEWSSNKSSSPCYTNSCNWEIDPRQRIYNFTLNAANPLGHKSANIIVDVTQRVRPLMPINLVETYLNSTHVFIRWSLRADYTELELICQTELQRDNGIVELRNIAIRGQPSSSFYKVILDQLQPFTNYALRVRCKADSPLSRWSNWSAKFILSTKEDVPTAALDTWRDVKVSHDGRIVTLYWSHLPDFHANGKIICYNVSWQPLEGVSEVKSTTVPPLRNSTQIAIDSHAYLIRVTALNTAGTSPPSEITIPAFIDRDDEQIKEEKTDGTGDGVFISWDEVSGVYLGYVVDWCNLPKSPHCDIQWKKYNSSVRNDVIRSRAFVAGVRYNFRIYGSKEDGEYLLEKRTGYKQELAPLLSASVKFTTIEPDVLTITWEPCSDDDYPEGFVRGYSIYLNSTGLCELKGAKEHKLSDGTRVCKFFNNDPDMKTFTIKRLSPNTTYAVAVGVLTGGGESPLDFRTAHTLSDSRNLILGIVLPIIIFSLVVIILSIICYQKRKRIKDLCYPDIPGPGRSQLFSKDGLKVKAEKNVMIPHACITQNIEIVNMQKDNNLDIYKYMDMEFGTTHQSDFIYKDLAKYDDTSENLEDNSSFYAKAQYKLFGSEDICKPQMQNYLEFFNDNYCPSTDDNPDILPNLGYKPQISHQLNDSTDQLQFVASETEQNSTFLSTEDIPTFISEQMSPTSINSVAFLLKD